MHHYIALSNSYNKSCLKYLVLNKPMIVSYTLLPGDTENIYRSINTKSFLGNNNINYNDKFYVLN